MADRSAVQAGQRGAVSYTHLVFIMKIYLQLWSVKDDTQTDFFSTLERVAEMGYAGVEFAGFGGIPAGEMKQKLDELGLEGISAHVGYDILVNDLEATLVSVSYTHLPIDNRSGKKRPFGYGTNPGQGLN